MSRNISEGRSWCSRSLCWKHIIGKATLKDNQNLIKSEINNVKTEENKVDKSTINNDNNKDKKLK